MFYADSLMLTGMSYSIIFVVMSAPVVPKITDVVLRNGTEFGQFPLPMVYYHFNEQKYYFYLMTYIVVSACVIVTPVISSDIMFIIYVHHVCGTFAALG